MKNQLTLKNSPGLSIEFLENGALRCINAGPVRISLKPATPYSVQGMNLYLRIRETPFKFKPLLGPESNSLYTVTKDAYIAKGRWEGLDYQCVLQLSKKSLSWTWRIEVSNVSGKAVELDLVCLQDAGLKTASDGLVNEYYVSQYLERRILDDKKYDAVICCRQNMQESGGNPWLMIACENQAIAASVDGMQFFGKTYRETGVAEVLHEERLGGEYSGESSMLALQEKPFTLAAGGHHTSVFAAIFLPDHPKATSEEDLDQLAGFFREFNGRGPEQHPPDFIEPVKNLFNTSGFLPVEDLTGQELDWFFGKERRHPESADGKLWSFFCHQNNHVALRTKEVIVDRPHAHIMQARTGFVPDESIVSTTSYAFGVFNSHLTQGNTNFNILLSVCTSQFNLSPETGQRIFVEIDGRQYLLGVPSAFETGLNHCRWIYKSGGHCFQVRTWTSRSGPQVNMDFRVVGGKPVKLLITHSFDPLNGWTLLPGKASGEYVASAEAGSMIAGKFPDARFRIEVQKGKSEYKAGGEELLWSDQRDHGGSFFVLAVQEPDDFCMSFTGEVNAPAQTIQIDNADEQWLADCEAARADWQSLCLNLSLKSDHEDISAIREILPWYGMNALTHFLTPFGPEQFSGAAWGTRDVAQGPMDLLLCMEKYAEARQVLRIIFSNQHADGGWPQWWMFDSYSGIRANSAHGDVVYWCIIALCNYIKVTGDFKILGEVLPYHPGNGQPMTEETPVSEHLDRLIGLIVGSFIPGTALVPFGGGDWNDSLQPVSKDLARRMISSWTVEMNYQAFMQLREVYEHSGNTAKAQELTGICERIRADFNKYLIRDGVVAGYGLVEEEDNIGVLLHPDDQKTGVHYSILPMNRGIISEIFSKEQALRHQELVEKKLKGPDGARLMDRPLKYTGGIQTIFQRAESSTFFGREIGLMYIHEHIRYAEALARTGKAEPFLKALRQSIPVAYRDVVPCGDVRQSNCYYSSSDVVFKNRYEAGERYEEILAGKHTLRGGWRVYSSGPGIFIGLVVSRLLGLRREFGNIIIDPVMPMSMDGLTASMDFLGYRVVFSYVVKTNCYGPSAVSINGIPVMFTREDNRYRQGGAVFPAGQFTSLLNRKENSVEIVL